MCVNITNKIVKKRRATDMFQRKTTLQNNAFDHIEDKKSVVNLFKWEYKQLSATLKQKLSHLSEQAANGFQRMHKNQEIAR
jgi:hypothetical protein